MSNDYGPLEKTDYDIESGTDEKKVEPIVIGKFKVIDELDKEHIRKIQIKKLKIRLCMFLFITSVVGISGLMVYYEDMMGTTDEFQDYQKPNLYNDKVDVIHGMSARVMGHHHRRKRCTDYTYGCCEIYYGPKDKDYFEISPYRIVKQDERGSNCPFLKDLVESYNINYKEAYQEGGTAGYCEIDTTYDSTIKNISSGKMYLVQPKDDNYGYNCNRIGDLVHLYEYGWPQDETFMDLMFLSFIIGLICCVMSRK